MNIENKIHAAVVKDLGKGLREIDLLDDNCKVIDTVAYSKCYRDYTLEVLQENKDMIEKTIHKNYHALVPFYIASFIMFLILIISKNTFIFVKILELCSFLSTAFFSLIGTIRKRNNAKKIKQSLELAEHNALLDETKQMVFELNAASKTLKDSQEYIDLQQEECIDIRDIYSLYNLSMENDPYVEKEKCKILKLKK